MITQALKNLIIYTYTAYDVKQPTPGMSFCISHNSLIAGVGKNPK